MLIPSRKDGQNITEGHIGGSHRMLCFLKMAIYCPQGSGTLRQHLLMMHGIGWYCIVLHSIAWYCMVLHDIAWYCMVLHDIA